MTSDTISIRAEPGALLRGEDTPLHALVIAWSAAEPHRVGEVAFLLEEGRDHTLGRGERPPDDPAPRVSFFRQRPGILEPTPPLEGPSISRRQLRVTPISSQSVRVECIGRRGLFVNGQRVDRAVVQPGSTILLEHQLLLLCVRRPLRVPALRFLGADAIHAFGHPDPGAIVGESPAVWSLRDMLAFAGDSDQHVLLLGASGTGKELAARSIHQLSARRAKPFVARNAATLPPGLIDVELFGNVRDYPNPGMREHLGLIGHAHGSTLFLDEIGEMSPESHAHLLRVLDDGGEYQRLGEGHTRSSSFRLIAATNRDLSSLKQDFVARCSIHLTTPGLEDRREDIPLLIGHLLRRAAASNPKIGARFFAGGDIAAGEPRVDPALLDLLLRFEYTLHLRELFGLLLRAMMLSPGDTIAPNDELRAADQTGAPTREAVQSCIERNGGNLERTWRELGLRNRHQLYRLMRTLGLRDRDDPE